MKALTVWQPWASLIAVGAKPFEFRSWKPPAAVIGQRIAIHAGARRVRPQEIIYLIQALNMPAWPTPCLHRDIAFPFLQSILDGDVRPPIGHVVCTAVLGEPKSGADCAREFGQDFGNDSQRDATFNWGWPLLEIEVSIPPIPAHGAQGLWDWRA